jgi:S1-C subfamily serine protease
VAAGVGSGVVFGAKLESVSADDKNSYRIDYGVKVVELNEGRFKDLGIRKGDIILDVNGKKVKTASEVREVTNSGQSLTSIDVIQSNGTKFSYQFKR